MLRKTLVYNTKKLHNSIRYLKTSKTRRTYIHTIDYSILNLLKNRKRIENVKQNSWGFAILHLDSRGPLRGMQKKDIDHESPLDSGGVRGGAQKKDIDHENPKSKICTPLSNQLSSPLSSQLS